MKVVGQEGDIVIQACRRTRSLQVTLVYITVINKILTEGAGLNHSHFLKSCCSFLTVVAVRRFFFLSFRYFFVFSEDKGGIRKLDKHKQEQSADKQSLGRIKVNGWTFCSSLPHFHNQNKAYQG